MSEYYKKYLKYKNKYLKLQTQIGGEMYTGVFCNELPKIQVATLILGDKIKFTFPPGKEISEFSFTVIENPGGSTDLSEMIRLKSENEIGGNPLLNITLNKKDNYSKLNFIRTDKGSQFTFDLLMNIYMCVTQYFNYPKMIIEDDALFTTTEEITYRALIFRVFDNKDSLYYKEPFIFRPTKSLKPQDQYLYDGDYTDATYQRDKSLLHNSHIGDFIEYYKMLSQLIKEDSASKQQKTPISLQQIEGILQSLEKFGPEKFTRDYIRRLQDDRIEKKEKEIINNFINKLSPYSFSNREYQQRFWSQLYANRDRLLYGAVPRIHYSHRDMISTNIICSFCTVPAAPAAAAAAPAAPTAAAAAPTAPTAPAAVPIAPTS